MLTGWGVATCRPAHGGELLRHRGPSPAASRNRPLASRASFISWFSSTRRPRPLDDGERKQHELRKTSTSVTRRAACCLRDDPAQVARRAVRRAHEEAVAHRGAQQTCPPGAHFQRVLFVWDKSRPRRAANAARAGSGDMRPYCTSRRRRFDRQLARAAAEKLGSACTRPRGRLSSWLGAGRTSSLVHEG